MLLRSVQYLLIYGVIDSRRDSIDVEHICVWNELIGLSNDAPVDGDGDGGGREVI